MRLFLLSLSLLLVPVVAAAPASARDGEVVNVAAPEVAGGAVFEEVLRASPGVWSPPDVDITYRWLRDGEPVRHARTRTYRLDLADIGHRMSVQVTATDSTGGKGRAVSEETTRVRRAVLTSRSRPVVSGVERFTHTVTATPGRWSAAPSRLRLRWLRDDDPIRGARRARYSFAPEDVGHRVRVRVTAYAEGYRPATSTSRVRPAVRHRVDVRRRVTYVVRTRGHVTADLASFRRLAQQTYDDPRGWRGKGVEFRRVAKGGSFTLVLAEARTVPSFSSACSSTYSCRVGRYVIINQTRWQHASPPWNAAGESLRDYRHLVVNHETGHWLGRGHATCPGPGRLAPVMMQQSKGRDGCRFNPWPTPAELRT